LAENAVRAAGLLKSELESTGLPQLQAVGDAVYFPVPPRYGYDPGISNGGEVRGLVSLRQSVYDSGLRGLRSDQIAVDLERLGHEQRLAGLDLVLAVKLAFFEALRAHAEAALERESIDQLEAYLGLVQRLHSGGSASATDLLKTGLQVSTGRLALAKAHESSLGAKIALEELVGLPPDTAVNLLDLPADTLEPPPDSARGTMELDPSRTLDMTIAGLLVRRSAMEEEIAGRERFPDISLFADAGYLTSGENLRLPPAERINGLGYSVGIGVQFPLFNWGATGLRVQERQLATDDLRYRMELLRRSIASGAAMTRMQLANARERLRVLRGDLVKARDNFILTKSKFAGGGALSLEVLAAQQALRDARLAEIQAIADIRSIASRIERLNAQ
jgi:outer membrane protein TolC